MPSITPATSANRPPTVHIPLTQSRAFATPRSSDPDPRNRAPPISPRPRRPSTI